MDPNMFGTEQEWRTLFRVIAFILILIIAGAFGLGAWIF